MTIIILVRFTDLTWSDKGKSILGYNETTGEWNINSWERKELAGNDGPYIYKKGDSINIINVLFEKGKKIILENKMIHKDYVSINKIRCEVDNFQNDFFYFQLQNDFITQKSYYENPTKIIAISDIEGNFDGLAGFLEVNCVINSEFSWTFGNGHLVVLGDLMDRGSNVTQVMWLLYKLEQEAHEQGGKVHYVLGNHEILNLEGKTRYLNKKYIAIAQENTKIMDHGKAYEEFIKNTELFHWMRSKNVIIQIGKYLFVHGGISPTFLENYPNINNLNIESRSALKNDNFSKIIFGNDGPLWFRGLVDEKQKTTYNINQDFVNRILLKYSVEKIIVGHTIVDDISYDFNRTLIRIDVKHGKAKNKGLVKGILIQENKIYKINDLGNEVIL